MNNSEVITQNIGENHDVAVYYPNELTPETPVIFMLHGNWATRGRNTKYAQYFSKKGFLVITPTYRHHYKDNNKGIIGDRLGKTSILDYVADIEFLIDQLYKGYLINHFIPKNQPIVMGHSMGGLVAQRLAAQRPEDQQLKALVLLCSAPPKGVSLHTTEDYKKRIKRFAGSILFSKPYLPGLELMAEYIYNGMPPEDYENLYAHAVYESGTSSREILAGSGTGLPKFLAKLFTKPIDVRADAIICPILIIGCENDKIIVPAIAHDLLIKYSQRSELTAMEIFDSFAHWVHYEENWETSAKFVYDWIEENVRM